MTKPAATTKRSGKIGGKAVRQSNRSRNLYRKAGRLNTAELRLADEPLTDQGTLVMEGLMAEAKPGLIRYDSSRLFNRSEDHRSRDELLRKFQSRLIVNPDLTRKLVSFQASKRVPFYRWLKYKEAFSPDLVDYLYDHLEFEEGVIPRVLDPFAGTGTVLTRASARKWRATGIELLPVGAHALEARFIADRVSLEGFRKVMDEFAGIDWDRPRAGWRFSHLRITEAAFSRRTEQQMSAYLGFVDRISDADVRFLFWFACMSVLEEVSFTRKDGQYLRWDRRSGREHAGHFDKGPILEFRAAIRERLREFQDDLGRRNGGLFSRRAKVIEGSCLYRLADLESGTFEAVLTSPPYCNRYDYTRTYALELAFCGCDEEAIRRLRQTLLSATVENKSKREEMRAFYERRRQSRLMRDIEQAFDSQAALHEVLALLCAARDRGDLSNPNVPNLVENYFFEMTAVIFEIARLLKRGGTALIVNDNVQYHGEEVPADLILSDLAEKAGLRAEKIWVLPRGKGNSSQQMGRWGRTELRKCVYVWKKP